MKYYFHLLNHTEQILDDVGIEISSPEQAYNEATRAIRELRDEAEQEIEWDDWRLEVTDVAGSVIFSIALGSRLH